MSRAAPRGAGSRRAWLLALAPLLALLAAAATLAFDRETGIPALRDVLAQLGEVRGRVEHLDAERTRLNQHVRDLLLDPFEIESVARGQLGMVRPDEVVILLERPPEDE